LSSGGNSHNGFSSKHITTEEGQFELDVPRDRDSSFEPQLIKKHQSRFTSMDDKYPQISRSWRAPLG
jgi:transposase-like protein